MKNLIIINLTIFLLISNIYASSSNSTLAQKSVSRYVESIVSEAKQESVVNNSLGSSYQMSLEKIESLKKIKPVDLSEARVGLVKTATSPSELLNAFRYRNKADTTLSSPLSVQKATPIIENKTKESINPIVKQSILHKPTIDNKQSDRLVRLEMVKQKYNQRIINEKKPSDPIISTEDKLLEYEEIIEPELENDTQSIEMNDLTKENLAKQVESIIQSSSLTNSKITTEPMSLYASATKTGKSKKDNPSSETFLPIILPVKSPAVSAPSYYSETKAGLTEKILPVEHVYINENETITTKEKTFDPFRLLFPTAFLPAKKTLNFTYSFGNITGKMTDKTLNQTVYNTEASSHSLYTSYSMTETIQLIAGYTVSETSNRIIVRDSPSYYDAFKSLISSVVDNVVKDADQQDLYKSFADNVTPSRRVRTYTLGINCKIKDWNKSSLNLGILDRKQKIATKGIGYYIDKNSANENVIIYLPETLPYSVLDAFKEIDIADIYINYSNQLSDSLKIHGGLKYRKTLFSILNENNAENEETFLPFIGADFDLSSKITGKAGFSKDEQSAEVVVHSSPDFFYSFYYTKEKLPIRTEWPTFIGSTAVSNQLAKTMLEQESETTGVSLNQKF